MTSIDRHISLLSAKNARQCNWFLCYGKVHKNGLGNLYRVLNDEINRVRGWRVKLWALGQKNK